MEQARKHATREKLIRSGTGLIRRNGYSATRVDDICEDSGVTKGAFFHHFKTKEQLAEACLGAWDLMAATMDSAAPFHKVPNPRERALDYMDFYIALFDNPKMLRSCLAGTVAQEVSDANPALRQAAHACFENGEKRFRAVLGDACRGSRRRIDTASLASLWIAAIQGSLILAKAAQDGSVIRRNLEHVRQYIGGVLPPTKEKT